MKSVLSILLCLVLCLSFLAVPVSAYFQVTYYNEEVYAGGILDLMAFVDDENLKDYSFRWQFAGVGSDSWVDLDDNANYKGTRTNHLQVYTKVDGDYEHWDEIPFRCLVTKDGESKATPNIHMHILPYDSMLKAMKNKGIGLYEPSLTNVTGLSSKDDLNYTASAYAGSNIQILCGGSTESSMTLLENSNVQLKREIKITENGKYTVTGGQTSYIPYTVGNNAVKIEVNMRIIMAGVDRGIYQTKTINLTTKKPDVMSNGTVKSDCSLLRYTYNESEKLASIPKGASVEVLSKEGSYYQVFYNNYVGYIGTSLLNVQTPSYNPVIKNVDVTVTAPVAGEKPSFTCNILTEGCQLYKTEPVTWYDKTEKDFLSSTDKFIEGHSYDLAIWLAAQSGYKFQVDASDKPDLTGSINGNLPPFINKAYEQDPEEVIELTYTFNNVKAKEPEQTHTCAPILVKRVEPTCTQKGKQEYYHCSCGMNYKDAAGTQSVDIGAWGDIPATGHAASTWRTTQVYHYKACATCGDFLEQEDHKGGVATCNEKGKCTVCGYAYIEENENHTPDTSKWIARADMYHYHACKLCGAHCDTEDHRWSPTYLYQDKSGHAWICADCKATSKIEKHNPGAAATETTPQTCKDCGYIIEPAKNHTHSLTKVTQVPATCTTDGVMEHYTCSGCSVLFADEQGKRQIDSASQLTLEALGHFTDQWVCDTQRHWQNCRICGTTIAAVLEEHLDTDADGMCDTCSYMIDSGSTAQENETTTTESADPGKETTPSVNETADDTPDNQTSLSEKNIIGWAMAVMIGLVCFGASITATVIILKRKKK